MWFPDIVFRVLSFRICCSGISVPSFMFLDLVSWYSVFCRSVFRCLTAVTRCYRHYNHHPLSHFCFIKLITLQHFSFRFTLILYFIQLYWAECKEIWDVCSDNLTILLKKSSERLVLRSNHPEISGKLIERAIRGQPKVFCKKGVSKNFKRLTWKPLCWSRFFHNDAGWMLWKENLAQVFFY